MSRVQRGESWRQNEDIALCTAVVHIGEDGTKGTSQQKSKLWDRIAVVYVIMKPVYGVERLGTSCEARWRRIMTACTKRREALTTAEAAISSGQNATNLELQAKSIYSSMNKGKEFMFAHCWGILANTLKFSPPISLPDNYNGPSPIFLDGDDVRERSSSASPSNTHPRPIGQKAQNEAQILLANELKKSNELWEREQEQLKLLSEITKCHVDETKRRGGLEQDLAIMGKDPSQYPPELRAFWEEEQARARANIQAARAQEAAAQEFRDWNSDGYFPTM